MSRLSGSLYVLPHQTHFLPEHSWFRPFQQNAIDILRPGQQTLGGGTSEGWHAIGCVVYYRGLPVFQTVSLSLPQCLIPSSYEDTNPIMGPPPSLTSLDPVKGPIF